MTEIIRKTETPPQLVTIYFKSGNKLTFVGLVESNRGQASFLTVPPVRLPFVDLDSIEAVITEPVSADNRN